MSIKALSLAVLVIQNSALILVMRYSRTVAGPKYIATTAVVLSELIKTIISTTILIWASAKARPPVLLDSPAFTDRKIGLQSKLRSLLPDVVQEIGNGSFSLPILTPAILYTIQNNLQYLAASNLDAATFSVLYQGKVLTTALFAVLILREKLSLLRWSAIFVLTCGIALISYQPGSIKDTGIDKSIDGRVIGLAAVLAACVLSGFTGVFVEHILKKAKKSHNSSDIPQLWVRNVQLSFASLLVAIFGAVLMDFATIRRHGFFYAYNPVVWLTIALQAGGGLVVAVVITYANNILKGFATSLSLILSTAISAAVGDSVLTTRFAAGAGLVLAATNMYSMPWSGRSGKDLADDLSTTASVGEDIKPSSAINDLEHGTDLDLDNMLAEKEPFMTSSVNNHDTGAGTSPLLR